uniref:Uncharacterized protein n=1 Tax=Bactrocera dorsalis TaxID=27457 RepID=A0A034WEX6_BACDO
MPWIVLCHAGSKSMPILQLRRELFQPVAQSQQQFIIMRVERSDCESCMCHIMPSNMMVLNSDHRRGGLYNAPQFSQHMKNSVSNTRKCEIKTKNGKLFF